MPPDYDRFDRFVQRHASIVQAWAVMVWTVTFVASLWLAAAVSSWWALLSVGAAVPCWMFGYWAYLGEDDGDNAG